MIKISKYFEIVSIKIANKVKSTSNTFKIMQIEDGLYYPVGVKNDDEAHDLIKYYTRYCRNRILGLTHASSDTSGYNTTTKKYFVGHRCVIYGPNGICCAALPAPISVVQPTEEFRLTHIETPISYSMICVIVIKNEPRHFILCTNNNIDATRSSFCNGLSQSNLSDQFYYLMQKKNLGDELITYIQTLPDFTMLVFAMTDLLKCNDDNIYFMYEVKPSGQIDTGLKFQHIPCCTVYFDMTYEDAIKDCKAKLPSFFSFNSNLPVLKQIPYKLYPQITDDYLKAVGNMPSLFQRLYFLIKGLSYNNVDKSNAYFKQHDENIVAERSRRQTIKRPEGLDHATAMKYLETLCTINPISTALFFYAYYRLAGRMMLSYDKANRYNFGENRSNDNDVEIRNQQAKLVNIVTILTCKNVHAFDFYTLLDIEVDPVFFANHMVKEMQKINYPPYSILKNKQINIARAHTYLQFLFVNTNESRKLPTPRSELMRDLFGNDTFESLLNESKKNIPVVEPTSYIEKKVASLLGLEVAKTSVDSDLNIESMTAFPKLG